MSNLEAGQQIHSDVLTRLPAPKGRTTVHTSPRSLKGAAASRASRPATWGRRRRSCGSRREVALNVGLAGLVEKGEFVDPEIRVIAFHVGIVPDMARPRRLQRKEICAKRAFVGSAISPKGPPCFRIRRQSFVVRNSVLDDERLDPVRMGQGHAKTYGAAVILHVKRVAREPERFGKVIHDLGAVIKRIREFFWVRPVAVSEPWVIGCDEVIAIGKPGEERLEHP